MPIIAPIKDPAKPYDFAKMVDKYNDLVGGGAYTEDLTALMNLLLPKTPAQSLDQTLMPGYNVSARVKPGAKALDIGLLESENKWDLVKLLKEIVLNSEKYGYTKVSGAAMPYNDQGGRSMASIFRALKDSSGYIPIQKLKNLIEDKSAALDFLQKMKHVPKDKRMANIQPWNFSHVLEPHSLTKQLSKRYKQELGEYAPSTSQRELSTQEILNELERLRRGQR